MPQGYQIQLKPCNHKSVVLHGRGSGIDKKIALNSKGVKRLAVSVFSHGGIIYLHGS